MSDWATILGAFGLGSVATAILQSWLNGRSRAREQSFRERKEAYVGLLEAYHRAAVEGTDAASKNFAYWQLRCDLVAPMSVRLAIEDILSSNDDPVRRNKAHNDLKNSMRNDLGISQDS